MPGIYKRPSRRQASPPTARRRQWATPLTPEELGRLKRRHPLWTPEAACLFELEGSMRVTEASDTVCIDGEVGWLLTKGRPRKIRPDIVASAREHLASVVRDDPSTRKHNKAVAELGDWFKRQDLSMPPIGQLNRAIIWPVVGKTKRGRCTWA